MIPVVVAGLQQSPGSNASQFVNSQDVYVDSNGNIHVTDYLNYQLQKYNRGSSFGSTLIGITGSNGTTSYQLGGPRYMAPDPSEAFISIADAGNHRIMRISTSTPSISNGTIVAGAHESCGANATLLCSSMDVKIDRYQNIYVMDGNGYLVQMFCANSKTAFTIAGTGTTGNGSKELYYARGIEFDSGMSLYVEDLFNKRV